MRNSRTSFQSKEGIAIGLGCLLGDACIQKNENRLQIEQSELDYVTWKWNLFRKHNLVTENCNIKQLKITRMNKEKGINKDTISYRFYSRSLFQDFHCFYKFKGPGDPTFNPNEPPKRRKMYIPQLLDWFHHPLALAIYYMDDGSAVDNQAYFSTGEVTDGEVILMQQVLKKNFDLDSSFRLSGDRYVGLLIRRKDCSKFLNLVEGYVSEVNGMERKLKITR